jgi:hypothetical protein
LGKNKKEKKERENTLQNGKIHIFATINPEAMKKTLITALAMLAIWPAMAQKRAFTIEDIYRVQTASSPTVAKDGRLAYTVSRSDLKAQKSYTNVVVDGQPVTTDNKSFAPIWSQLDQSLYYLSYADGTTQVYRYANGKHEKITDYALGVDGVTISPDGNLIAFAAEVLPEIGGADGQANKAAFDKKAQNPIQAHLADSLFLRHWTDYADGKYWHIIVYNIKEKTYTDVTPVPTTVRCSRPADPRDSSSRLTQRNMQPEQPRQASGGLYQLRPLDCARHGWPSPQHHRREQSLGRSPQYSPDGRYSPTASSAYPATRATDSCSPSTTGRRDRSVCSPSSMTTGWTNPSGAADSKSIYIPRRGARARPL